jgi:chaperonin GroES
MAKSTSQSTKTNITPLHNFVLIRPVQAEEKTAGGIILPDTVKEKPQIGEVMAVGEGTWNEDGDERIPVSVKVGQKVMYKKWGGNEVKVNGEDWTLVEDKDILAVVN